MTDRSVTFDRAAEYYDSTRVTSDAAMAQTIDVLVAELRDRGPILEVGVGTGLVAIPLQRAGLDLFGVDLSRPMLAKLLEKGGGRAPLPVAQADATRLPFRDDTFGAAYLRWVLHLIPEWRSAAAELVRIVRPSGVVVVNHGGFAGSFRLVRERTEEIVGRPLRPVGLAWDRWEDLAAEMRALGATRRTLARIVERSEEPLATAVEGVRANRYSWTWGMAEGERTRAAEELGRWLRTRVGDLHAPYIEDVETVWHAYDVSP